MGITLQSVMKEGSKTPKIKLKRLMTIKKYYLSMYRANMVRLYSLDYISDPTRFNDKEIKQDIIELGIIADITSYTGVVSLSSETVKFALYKNKGNEEVCQFLSILYQVMRYKELSEKVDIIYEEYNFYGVDSAKVKLQMLQKGAMVVQKSGLVFDEAMARVISPFEKVTKCISFNDSLWEICMECLGIPQSEWNDDGLFDEGLSHDEEVECAEGILNGCFHISGGKYIATLEEWLLAHRWSETAKFQADTKGLYDYIYCVKSHEVEDVFNKRLCDIDGDILSIQKDKVYFNVDRSDIELPIGVFTVMCNADLDEELLSTGNALYGYTGEVYTEERLIADEATFVGCPIYVSTGLNKVELVYDVEQTDIPFSSWFTEEGMCIDFSEKDAESLPDNPFSLGTLEYDIYNAYKHSLSDADNLIYALSTLSSTEAELASAYKKVYKTLEGI